VAGAKEHRPQAHPQTHPYGACMVPVWCLYGVLRRASPARPGAGVPRCSERHSSCLPQVRKFRTWTSVRARKHGYHRVHKRVRMVSTKLSTNVSVWCPYGAIRRASPARPGAAIRATFFLPLRARKSVYSPRQSVCVTPVVAAPIAPIVIVAALVVIASPASSLPRRRWRILPRRRVQRNHGILSDDHGDSVRGGRAADGRQVTRARGWWRGRGTVDQWPAKVSSWPGSARGSLPSSVTRAARDTHDHPW